MRTDATQHDEDIDAAVADDARNVLCGAKDSDKEQRDATPNESTPGRTRTSNLRIRSPQGISEKPEKNKDSRKRAAPGAAPSAEDGPDAPRLTALADALAALPEADRPATMKHLTALAKLGPQKLAAIRALMDGSGDA